MRSGGDSFNYKGDTLSWLRVMLITASQRWMWGHMVTESMVAFPENKFSLGLIEGTLELPLTATVPVADVTNPDALVGDAAFPPAFKFETTTYTLMLRREVLFHTISL